MREHRDPYVVLGVARQASATEIARAFRQAARETHPDSSAAGSGSADRFRAVSDAYETLRDPQRRAAYDRAHPVVRTTTPSRGAAPSSVGYASPGGQHIRLGVSSSPALWAGDVQVESPPRAPTPTQPDPMGAQPLALLVFSLLRTPW